MLPDVAGYQRCSNGKGPGVTGAFELVGAALPAIRVSSRTRKKLAQQVLNLFYEAPRAVSIAKPFKTRLRIRFEMFICIFMTRAFIF